MLMLWKTTLLSFMTPLLVTSNLPTRRRSMFHELLHDVLRALDWLILTLLSSGSSSGLRLYIGLKPERILLSLVSIVINPTINIYFTYRPIYTH